MSSTSPHIPTIVGEALEFSSPQEREAYLQRVCGDDAQLRSQVGQLLRDHARAGDFLEQPAGGPTLISIPIADASGLVIGSYKLLELIGQGGMGAVYMAQQTTPVKRQVALKIIIPGMDTKEVIARFEAERQALAMMDHPNIARILDGGATEHGRPYFVMELVRGIPLTQYCDEARLTTRERLELFIAVCRAIQHAHQKGIIHRDLKPSNVMVTMHDDKAVIKVIDFGIAKALSQPLTDRTLFTGYQQLLGTPLYMSPEQVHMTGIGVDTRSDVYSLGVLLYELLTGTTPFTKESLANVGFDELRRIIREQEPPRPSERITTLGAADRSTIADRRQIDQRKVTDQLRGELDWIAMKALEKDRNRRYESASAFALDIQRYLNDQPVMACPPSAGYRLQKFLRRNKGSVIAGAALVTLLILGTVSTSIGLMWALQAQRMATRASQSEAVQRKAAETQRDRALASEKQAINDSAIALALNDFLLNDLLAQAAPENNARENQVTVEEVLARAATRIAGRFDEQPQIEAAIRQTIGDTYRSLGDYTAAQPHLERALELRRRILGEEHEDTLLSTNNLAEFYREFGLYEKAEPLYLQALQVLSSNYGEQHPRTLTTMNNLAMLHFANGQLAEAEALHTKTLKLRRQVLGDEHYDSLASMNNLASVYEARGKIAMAEPLYVRILELLDEEDTKTPIVMNNLAGLYRQQGLYEKAEPLFAKSLELSRKSNGEEHPATLLAMNNLAGFYAARRQYAKAEPLLMKVLDVSRRDLTAEHPRTLATMNNLASVYQSLGQLSNAEKLYVEALEVARRVMTEEHPDTLTYMNNLAGFYLAGQQYVVAEPLLRASLSIRERKEPDAWRTFVAKSLLGKCLLGQEKYTDAERYLLESYAGLKQREAEIPVPSRRCLTENVELLIQLYTSEEKIADAERWQKVLNDF